MIHYNTKLAHKQSIQVTIPLLGSVSAGQGATPIGKI